MNIKTIFFIIPAISCISCGCSIAQVLQQDTSIDSIDYISSLDKVLDKCDRQYVRLSNKLMKYQSKAFKRFSSRRDQIYNEIKVSDSILAKQLNSEKQMAINGLQSRSNSIGQTFDLTGEYFPEIDSMTTGLAYLKSTNRITVLNNEHLDQLTGSLNNLNSNIQKANDYQSFFREEYSRLKLQLGNTGYPVSLKKLNKQVYYYQERLKEFKEILHDKNKAQSEVLKLVRNSKAFEKFWKQNSYLSRLFFVPDGGPNSAAIIPGLQTTSQVADLLLGRIGNTTSGMGLATNNIRAILNQQLQPASGMLNEIKDKLNESGCGGNSDMTIPDFKPNEQRTKSFFKRFEYGLSFQSVSNTNILPATTDIGLFAGYKANEKFTIGAGIAYKLGLGSGLDKIKISNEGVGFKGYFDRRLKGKIWISGGFEYTYNASFKNLESLNDNIDVWQRSALLGITKKYKIRNKKEAKIQLLYDFLAAFQMPRMQSLKFRIAYCL